MALGGIAQLVDALNRSIARGIEANGVFRAADIVINRAGHTNARNPLTGQRLRAAEGTVTANADQAVNPEVLAGIRSLLQPLLGQHFLTACRIQHGAALADDAVYTARRHFDNVAVDKTAVTAADAKHRDIVCRCSPNNCANDRVHARSIAAAR